MKDEIRVLLLEDNAFDGKLLVRQLKKNWNTVTYERVYSEKAMISLLKNNSWDIILSDFKMPQFSGLQALKILKESKLDIPFIMVSGAIGEDKAVEVMRAGAQDYILKDNIKRLCPAIEREIRESANRKNKQETEIALQESERIWSITFSAIADGILILNQKGVVIKANPAALDIFELKESEILNLTCPKLIDQIKCEDEYVCLYDKMINDNCRVSNELYFNENWYMITLDPIYSECDKIIKSVCVINNITKLKRSKLKLEKANQELSTMHEELEEKIDEALRDIKAKEHLIIKQARRSSAVDLLAKISHHWRQPLNLIAAEIQNLTEAFFYDDIKEDQIQKKVDEINKHLNKLSRSIDLFRNTHIYDTQKPIICIKDILSQLIQFKEESLENCSVKINYDYSGDCKIHGSPIDFSHAVNNLLENAYDILLKNNIVEPVINITCKELNGDVVVSIIDNGGGIDPSIRDTMFELYTTSKNNLNFTGAGLYVSKLIFEKNMHGKIEVDESRRPFTEFIITLPKKA